MECRSAWGRRPGLAMNLGSASLPVSMSHFDLSWRALAERANTDDFNPMVASPY